MNPGKLRHRVTFTKLVEGRNEVGDDVFSDQDWKTVWASVEPLRGREYFEAQKIQAETISKITIRYLDGITHDMKIRFQNRVFEIQSIINIEERNRYLEIYAVEKVSKNVGKI